MATPKKRTTIPKKATAKKTTRTASRKRKAKKPKVKLSAQKVYLLTGLIVLVCAISLAVSVIFSAPKGEKTATAREKTEQVAKIEPKASAQTKKTEIQSVAPRQQPTTAKTNAPQPQKNTAPTSGVPAQKSAAQVQSGAARQNTVAAEAKTSVAQTQSSAAAQQPTASQSQSGAMSAKTTAAQTQATTASAKTTTAGATSATTTQNKPASQATTPIPAPNPATAVASAKAEKPQPTPPPKQEQKSPFAVPPAKNGATLVFVIDDAGRSAENVRKYTALPFPITIAVLPKLPQSRACADAVRAAGKEAILHQPMQAMNTRLDPGPGAIKGDMTFAEIGAVIKENLAELGAGIKGMNNHEGSLITADVIRIGAVLDVCQEMGMYFLDSRTTAETKAPQAALERDMHIFEKAGPYLDNDIDREKMLARIYETLTYANNHGRAIVIGHVDKSVKILPQLLADIYPYLVQAGYKFATPSQLR